jgi:ABC-type Fe3+/spermidine/putrescine transport system ATPase subunit
MRPLPHATDGLKVQVMVRPEKVKVLKSQPGFEQNSIEGSVREVLYKGPVTQFVVQPKDENIPLFTAVQTNSAVSAKRTWSIGDKVYLGWLPEDCILMGENGALPVPKLEATPLEILAHAAQS